MPLAGAVLRAALAADVVAAAVAVRVGERAPARCEVLNGQETTSFSIEASSEVIWENSVPCAAFQYSIGQPGRLAHILSELVPLGGGTGVGTLQGHILQTCRDMSAARAFATRFSYDLVSLVILAFAANPDSCAAEFRDGTRFEFHYRCGDRADEEVRIEGTDETLAQYRFPTRTGSCHNSAEEEWQCDLEPVRRLLLLTWMRLMAFLPDAEKQDVFRHVSGILQCSSMDNLLTCVRPEVVQRRLLDLFPDGRDVRSTRIAEGERLSHSTATPEGRAKRAGGFMDAALLMAVPARYLWNTGVFDSMPAAPVVEGA
mmetsp:Transcript_68765/g.199496  ORF Transcript_68765/g.199496 Transcript_68765/m.199496 type:complete len:315 (-) Transcript_68765:133-1077(-)